MGFLWKGYSQETENHKEGYNIGTSKYL